MANDFFKFREFTVKQDKTAMKVGTDSVVFGSCLTVCGNESRILDVGTGTGLLALMAAQRFTSAQIVAVEIDPSACEQARQNVENSKWGNRISVVHCDVRQYADAEQFDLIIANPPYFSNSLKSPNPKKNFARHDDFLSLHNLIDCVVKLLSETGRFALIIPAERAANFAELAGDKALFPLRKINICPTTDKPSSRVIFEFSRLAANCMETTLILGTASGEYSDQYRRLTKDYIMPLPDVSAKYLPLCAETEICMQH
ncbi:MAG: tRNA (adenine(22)-N(1))-methyltransferase TrmK [Prevotellaceae bacterium]|nr:tRNA (adenine(22)-N(1))-methyltransferase TrmK [Prevotellaceae bacterium]